MTPQLPATLDRYFSAQNAHDVEAMVACFAPSAKVRDEGHDHIGTDAIRRWKAATSTKYQVSVEPLELRQQDEHVVVIATVTGNFQSSPADLAYRFSLTPDGLIATLEVR